MDFFAQQDRARKKTRLLIFYFALAIVCIIAAIYSSIVALLLYSEEHIKFGNGFAWWQPELLFWVVAGTVLTITIGTFYKIIELRSGGRVVAAMLGGRPVNLHTIDPDERKLLNIVEEMSIASGTPMPSVYVLDDEDGLNAFAAGNDTGDAVVAVTRGSIKLLTRDELQGVIGHEFSHLLNGDMRLNIRLMGLLHGILLIALIGRVVVRFSDTTANRSSGKKSNAGASIILGFLLIIVGYIGVFFANLIKCAVSRQREFLADASAVQFTRNPAGIGGALKKIARASSLIYSPSAEQASHLYFADGIAHNFSSLFSTHPPIEERIRAIDPNFDGNLPVIITPAYLAKAAEERKQMQEALGLSSGYHKATPANFIDTTGTVSDQHFYYAQALSAAIPDALRTSVREAHAAQAIIFSLLLNSETETRQTQLSTIGDNPMLIEMEKLAPDIRTLTSQQKIALIDLSIPALRQMSVAQYETFISKVDALIAADQSIDLFEYMISRILRRHLDIAFGKAKPPQITYKNLASVLPEATVLISAFAHLSDTGSHAREAFDAAVKNLEISPLPTLSLLPDDHSNLEHVNAALDKLSCAAPFIKKNLLFSCATAVMHDKKTEPEEIELLRAVADSLGCPTPPLILS